MEKGTMVILALTGIAMIVLLLLVGAAVWPDNPTRPAVDSAVDALGLKSVLGGLLGGSSGPGGDAGNKNPKGATPTPSVQGPTIPPGEPDPVAINNSTVMYAFELAQANPIASAWFLAHSGWWLNEARSESMDAYGNSGDWILTYADGSEVMIVNIQDGVVKSSNMYTSTAAVMMGSKPDSLIDSKTAMSRLMADCSGLIVSQGSMPFSVTLHTGKKPTYRIVFPESGTQPGFSATIDAQTSEILENDYRRVTS